VRIRSETTQAGRRPDGLLAIAAPDGTSAVVLIETRALMNPRDVDVVARQVEAYADGRGDEPRIGGSMVVAPFVSPTTRDQLNRSRIGWFDGTGNLRLRLDSPAVFVDRAGADRSPFRDRADRQLKSLRGPGAAKVVLELCESTLPVGVRDLAGHAHVGVATSARVLELLAREAVISRDESGAVISVSKPRLVGRWALDHEVMTANEVIPALDPRGLGHALSRLSEVDTGVTVTGSAAARAYLPGDITPVSPLTSLSLYADDPIGLMAEVGLTAVARGANVLVMRPYDEVVHAKARRVGGLRCVPPAQVVADLMTGPGRSSEEAEQLLAALVAVEPGWES
jgi:hypothetical protein